MKFDELKDSAFDPASLERSLAALEGELAKPPPRSWRADVALLLAVSWGLAGAMTLVLFFTDPGTGALALRHLPALGLLLGTGGLAAFAALSPPGRLPVAAALVAAGLGLSGLVFLRALDTTAASTLPPWVCTLSHLGTDAIPLVIALLCLRRSAPHTPRALLAGVAAGSCGALIGEVGCGQSWQHVLLFHGGAWALIALASAVIARRLKRFSYAP